MQDKTSCQIDCKVTLGGNWAACEIASEFTVRTRTVHVEPSKNGRACPALKEEALSETCQTEKNACVRKAFGHWWHPVEQEIGKLELQEEEAAKIEDFDRAEELVLEVQKLKQKAEVLKMNATEAAVHLAQIETTVTELEKEKTQAVKAKNYRRAKELKFEVSQLLAQAENLRKNPAESEAERREKERRPQWQADHDTASNVALLVIDGEVLMDTRDC